MLHAVSRLVEAEVRVSLLGVERGESSKIEGVDPSGRGGVEGHLPELHVLHHELVGALHVVERPPRVVLAQVLDEDLARPDYLETIGDLK
jgi:hypothetical protein